MNRTPAVGMFSVCTTSSGKLHADKTPAARQSTERLEMRRMRMEYSVEVKMPSRFSGTTTGESCCVTAGITW
jgi:hypothetical protein